MTRQEVIAALLCLALLGLTALCSYEKENPETDSDGNPYAKDSGDSLRNGPSLSALHDPAFVAELDKVNYKLGKPIKACDGLRSIDCDSFVAKQMQKRYDKERGKK